MNVPFPLSPHFHVIISIGFLQLFSLSFVISGTLSHRSLPMNEVMLMGAIT